MGMFETQHFSMQKNRKKTPNFHLCGIHHKRISKNFGIKEKPCLDIDKEIYLKENFLHNKFTRGWLRRLAFLSFVCAQNEHNFFCKTRFLQLATQNFSLKQRGIPGNIFKPNKKAVKNAVLAGMTKKSKCSILFCLS